MKATFLTFSIIYHIDYIKLYFSEASQSSFWL